MAKNRGIFIAYIAFALFVLGGIATFGGLGLLAFRSHQDVMGLGDGRSMGVSLVIVGLIGSVGGVMLMRLWRNRI